MRPTRSTTVLTAVALALAGATTTPAHAADDGDAGYRYVDCPPPTPPPGRGTSNAVDPQAANREAASFRTVEPTGPGRLRLVVSVRPCRPSTQGDEAAALVVYGTGRPAVPRDGLAAYRSVPADPYGYHELSVEIPVGSGATAVCVLAHPFAALACREVRVAAGEEGPGVPVVVGPAPTTGRALRSRAAEQPDPLCGSCW